MSDLDLSAALASPLVRVALGVIGAALLLVLGREVRKIPAKLAVLMATAFLDMVGLLMLVPLLPFYVKKLGGFGAVFGNEIGIGLSTGIVVSAFTVAQLVSSPLWGRFSDKHGRRPTLLIALGASGIAYLVFGFAHTLPLLLLSRVVQGAGGGTVGVIQAYVADTTLPEDRARALGWLSAATNLGVALGPVLGSFALSISDLDLLPGPATVTMGDAAPGIVAALLCALNMVFAAIYLRESKQMHPAHGAPARTKPMVALTRVVSHPGEPASRVILTYAIAIGASQGISAVMALFLNARFQVSEKTIGYFFMYIGAISVFARVLLLGRFVDRFGEAKLSRIGIVTLAAGIVGMPLAGSIGTLALAVALIPLGTAFTFPCVTALLSRVISAADRGLYMGLQQTFGGFARIAAPLFYGWAFDTLGIAVPFFFSAAFVLVTLFLGFGLDRFAPPKVKKA